MLNFLHQYRKRQGGIYRLRLFVLQTFQAGALQKSALPLITEATEREVGNTPSNPKITAFECLDCSPINLLHTIRKAQASAIRRSVAETFF